MQKQGRPLKMISQRIRLGTYSYCNSVLEGRCYQGEIIPTTRLKEPHTPAQVAGRLAERNYQISIWANVNLALHVVVMRSTLQLSADASQVKNKAEHCVRLDDG